jgi:putative transposase
MIRTHRIPCKLNRAVADALNLASGGIYTGVLVAHWRVVRKKGIWLSEKAGTRLSDSLVEAALHAHTIDAAQQGFYKACKTAKAAKKLDPKARYPHWPKKFRTTIWKHTAIKRGTGTLELSNGLRNPKLTIVLPAELQDVLSFQEVRLVYDKRGRCYVWHIVVENGQQPRQPQGQNTVSVDLGEVHPAVVGDEQEATLILCRERRHEAQGHAKRLATMSRAMSRKQKGSKRYTRLVRAKSRMKAKHERIIRDIEHKVSRAIVDVAVERKANTIAIGDLRDMADGVALVKQTNQKISGWSHGKVRKLVEYKAQAEGIAVVLIDEHYTSQTCPHRLPDGTVCGHRHKPRGRVFRCPSCGFQSHRDVVGQINNLSVFKHGVPGKLPVPTSIKHRLPYDIRFKRSCLDTGQGGSRPVAREPISREADGL